MLAGEQGTGKTTIARYLIGKGPTRMRKSTDGIGLYTGLSYIDRETDEWLDGKQDFSLAELTISRSLRQTPLGLHASSLSPEVSINLSNTHDSKLIYDASVQFKEHLEGSKDRYKMSDGPFEREKKNIGLKEQTNFNISTHSISDDSPITDKPPDLDTLQVETPVQNASVDLDKTKWHFKDERLVHGVLFDPDNRQEDSTNVLQGLTFEQDNQEDKTIWPKAHPPDKRPVPVQNVHFDSDTQERKSKNDQFVYHEKKRDDKYCRQMQDILFTNKNETVQDDVPNSLPDIDSQHRDRLIINAMKRNLLSSGHHHKYSNDDISCKDSDDIIEVLPMTVDQTNEETIDESHAYKANLVSPLITSSKRIAAF
ncbi:unnamed protein product [Mytilus edulis]|uniref:Uncharacterized protein n=1 Tax=Mytilus edulis TaxID=6550 RepID=A0A8S3UN06_MYTED|nr:unnamed protein product [Mytilus edulis]